MAKQKARKYEANTQKATSLKPVHRPSLKAPGPQDVKVPIVEQPQSEEERRTLVLKLIDFLEAF